MHCRRRRRARWRSTQSPGVRGAELPWRAEEAWGMSRWMWMPSTLPWALSWGLWWQPMERGVRGPRPWGWAPGKEPVHRSAWWTPPRRQEDPAAGVGRKARDRWTETHGTMGVEKPADMGIDAHRATPAAAVIVAAWAQWLGWSPARENRRKRHDWARRKDEGCIPMATKWWADR